MNMIRSILNMLNMFSNNTISESKLFDRLDAACVPGNISPEVKNIVESRNNADLIIECFQDDSPYRDRALAFANNLTQNYEAASSFVSSKVFGKFIGIKDLVNTNLLKVQDPHEGYSCLWKMYYNPIPKYNQVEIFSNLIESGDITTDLLKIQNRRGETILFDIANRDNPNESKQIIHQMFQKNLIDKDLVKILNFQNITALDSFVKDSLLFSESEALNERAELFCEFIDQDLVDKELLKVQTPSGDKITILWRILNNRYAPKLVNKIFSYENGSLIDEELFNIQTAQQKTIIDRVREKVQSDRQPLGTRIDLLNLFEGALRKVGLTDAAESLHQELPLPPQATPQELAERVQIPVQIPVQRLVDLQYYQDSSTDVGSDNDEDVYSVDLDGDTYVGDSDSL